MKTLVIAAHPDDEVLGMGGTIQKLAEDGEVYLCILTVGTEEVYGKEVLAEKRKECETAAELLGITKGFYCEFPTLTLNSIPQVEINKKIEDIIKEVEPEQVFTHYYGDVNRDHQVAFNCTLTATRPLSAPSVKKVVCYEVMSSSEWGNPDKGFIPNMFVDISKYLDKKIEALKIYKTEAKENPNPRSPEKVKVFAQSRGGIIGVEAAETFKIIREIK
jgi:LmbE family N-acetylglucosaminyl deacetylase